MLTIQVRVAALASRGKPLVASGTGGVGPEGACSCGWCRPLHLALAPDGRVDSEVVGTRTRHGKRGWLASRRTETTVSALV